MTDCPASIARLFNQIDGLPAMQPTVQALITRFNDKNISVDYLTRRIASDPMLSARLLRLANSTAFNVSGSIATVESAIALLGFINVRTLVISIALTGYFEKLTGIDKSQFWQHSLRTAVIARFLAQQAGMDAELAYFIGLMHALGELVMQLAIPETMLKIEQKTPWPQMGRALLERETLGYSYAEVSAELLQRWQFPEIFSTTIAQAANPTTRDNPLAGLIRQAVWHAMKLNAVETGTDFTQADEEAMPTLPEGLLDGIEALIP